MHKLKEIRKLRGLSQKELAKLAGTSSVNISYLEIKRRGMSERWIEKLSEVLHCTKAQLLGEEPLEGLSKLPQEIQQDQRTFLHTIRSKKGLSINELAKMIGVSRQLLWKFENGKSTLSENVLSKVAEALNVSVEYLTTGKESAEAKKPEQKFNVVSSNDYPIKDEYLGHAMEIVDEMIDHDFHSREEKTHILSEVYKLVYDFYENNDDKKDFVKEIEQKMTANEGFLKFLNKRNLGQRITDKLLVKGKKKIKN